MVGTHANKLNRRIHSLGLHLLGDIYPGITDPDPVALRVNCSDLAMPIRETILLLEGIPYL